ncbi:FAD-dependent oxidoreductase, partial [Chromobacterium haemolyticum]
MGGSRVLVVGAGVIGLCSAWRLARAGWPVTVLERRGEAA